MVHNKPPKYGNGLANYTPYLGNIQIYFLTGLINRLERPSNIFETDSFSSLNLEAFNLNDHEKTAGSIHALPLRA